MESQCFSYWEKMFWYETFDFVIVGSGIVGLTTSLELRGKFPNANIAVVDRGLLPLGASTKNAGFACFATVGEIINDLDTIEFNEVVETIKMRWQGLELLKKNLKDFNIAYEANGGYEVFESKEKYEECLNKLDLVNSLIFEAIGKKEVIKADKQSFSSSLYGQTLFNDIEGQLNPVLVVKALIKKAKSLDIHIINGVDVGSIEAKDEVIQLSTKGHLNIKSRRLILCTNAFTGRFYKELDLIPARNQVLVSEKISNFQLSGTFHLDKGYTYFRNINNRLLIGGARNIDSDIESTSQFGQNVKVIDHLKEISKSIFIKQEIKFEFEWSGIIATGLSKKPLIKEVKKNVFIAVRLGGMGVAIGSMVAKSIANLVEETV